MNQRFSFLHEGRWAEHQVDEEDEIGVGDLMNFIQFEPAPMISGQGGINDDLDIEFYDHCEVSTNLLGDQIAVSVSVADDNRPLHGAQPNF